MPKGNLAQHSTFLYQLAFGGLFLLIVLWASKTMLGGSTKNVKMVGVMMAGVAVVLAMDKHYWLILPLVSALGVEIPGLPFSTVEIGQIAVITVYFVRKSLSKTNEYPVKFNNDLMIVFPLMLWIFGMFCYDPCGMQIFGSTKIGGRAYLQILLGFLSFLVISSWRLGEKECKLLFWMIIIPSIINLSKTFVGKTSLLSFGPRKFSHDVGTFYEFIGFITLYIMMFSRYKLSEILGSFKKFAAVIITGALVAYSGKRMMFGWVIMTPIIKYFLTKRETGLTLVCAIIGIIIGATVVAGDLAGIYELPKSARRAFAVVSPQMREKYGIEGHEDKFRQIVHAEAERIIRENPWFGLKGLAIDAKSLYMIAFGIMGRTYGHDVGHGEARGWHGALYAYAVDFGIPCLILFLFFMVCAACKIIGFCWRYLYTTTIYQNTMLLNTAILFCLSLLTLKTSGNSTAITGYLYTYGLFLAIRNGFLEKKNESDVSVTQSNAII